MIWIIVFFWYLIGALSYFYFFSGEQDITVSDLLIGLLAGLLGIIIPLIILFVEYGDEVVIKQRKHKE